MTSHGSSDAVQSTDDYNRDMIGCGLAVFAALNAALAIIYVRKLADRVNCSLQPMYYMLGMCLFCPIWSLVAPIKEAGKLALYGWELYLAAFGLAIVGFSQQATMAKSMEYNTVGVV